jgi:NNP family nitrate/nitrite transporter-like MFS transporter
MPRENAQPFPLLPILFVTSIFYLTFVSRVIMGPLLPVIEKEMGWGHGQAGSIFLYVATGYAFGLLFAGSVSSRLNHRRTLALSSALVGASLIALSLSSTVLVMRIELMLLGLPAGLYLPSGVTALTDLASQEDWGRTMSIHELGPNLGYITAPLIAEGLIRFFPWRGALAVLGVLSVLTGFLFLLLGRGGEGRGEPPRWEMMQSILRTPALWILIMFFTISIGASIGVYSMMPLFLVSEAGFERGWANTLIAISRIFATIALFGAGLLTDRFGPKNAMAFYLSLTGLFTLALGCFHGSQWIIPIFFLQTTAAASLFPIGFTILSLTFPNLRRSSAVSLTFLFAFFLGGGLTPTAIGYWAEAFSFSSALILLGLFFLGLLPLFLHMGSRVNLSRD